MALQYPNFTELYDKWFHSIYQCCFLLCSDSSAARQVTFQVFLRIGSIEKSFGTKEEEMYALFQWVVHDCENYFYRKPRRKPNQKRLTNQHLPFTIQESLITLLCFPFTKKAAFFLVDYLRLPIPEAAKILRLSESQIKRLHSLYGKEAQREQVLNDITLIIPGDGDKDILFDEIYFRFEERNVALENRLIGIRSKMDRLVPWFALFIILFCFVAVVYASGLSNQPLVPKL